ncbi:MAG: HD domain-containing protein [Peptococcaceae bacterium]|nr:HD domain-containing protein [Peptococcaceae bacterium]
MASRQELIEKTKRYIRERLGADGTGHDWWHVCRVHNMAVKIGQQENADLVVVELAALLHDIADWKFVGGDRTVGPSLAREWLERNSADGGVIDHVCRIIEDISFKGAKVDSSMRTTEGKVVQDADRLDAIGAIGIGRAFAYGGHKNRLLYDPNVKLRLHESPAEYLNSQSPTFNHFFEKLLLLKDLMNTEAGKTLAGERHKFVEEFLARFLDEWHGS